MPQDAWSDKRERRYEHVKENPSRLSRQDISSGRRGGLRSGTRRAKGRTKDQLYNEAKRMGIDRRSKMSKAELERAVDRRK